MRSRQRSSYSSIGRLDAVTINLKHGKLNFAVIDGDSFDALEGKTVIVPWSAVSLSGSGKLSVDAAQKQLESAAFEKHKVPFLGDPRFGEHIYDRFDQDPYWPAEETDQVWMSGGHYGYWPYGITPGIYFY